MEEIISIEENGVKYTAEYAIFNDTLIVYLPDGSTRETELKGLKPESAARVHLLSFVKSQQNL